MLDPQKRAFLVDILGEERVKALEERLPRMQKDLMAAGIAYREACDLGDILCQSGQRAGWQSFEEMAGARQEPQGDTVVRPFAGATSFAEAEAWQRAQETAQASAGLLSDFELITRNILTAADLSPEQRTAALKQAVIDLEDRIGDALAATGAKAAPDALAVAQGLTEALANFATTAARIIESDETPAAKAAALKTSLSDLEAALEKALAGTGAKGYADSAHPADPHLAALFGTPSPHKDDDVAAGVSVKEMRESRHPAGEYVVALVEQGAVQG